MSILEYLILATALVFIQLGMPVILTLLVAIVVVMLLKLLKGERL